MSDFERLAGLVLDIGSTHVEHSQQRPCSALETQVGGSHYTAMAIQPAEYCHANRIEKLEGDVIAYVSRWRLKGGIQDLEKARHTLDLLIELEARRAAG